MVAYKQNKLFKLTVFLVCYQFVQRSTNMTIQYKKDQNVKKNPANLRLVLITEQDKK